MKINTCLIYSSIDGQTRKICERIERILSANNHNVDIFNIEYLTSNLNAYDKIIIASSIRYGKHHEKILAFINENQSILENMKNAFISVNLVARKATKAGPNTNPYVIKFLDNITWTPNMIGVFAGKLDYKKYTFLDRLMIQLIMLITKGPIDPKTEIEYTDWNQVDNFALIFAEM